MIEILKTFFGGSMSAIEAFVGSVGLMGILSIVISIFYNTYKSKKTNKEIESVKAENKAIIDSFIEQHKIELEALKTNLTKDLDNISNMVMLEASKSGVDMDKFNQIVELYKKVIKDEILDTDKLEEEKKIEIETTQTTQEQVNENLNNIDKVLNDENQVYFTFGGIVLAERLGRDNFPQDDHAKGENDLTNYEGIEVAPVSNTNIYSIASLSSLYKKN